MWALSSLTRDWNWLLCIARQILNHWTTREVPDIIFLIPILQMRNWVQRACVTQLVVEELPLLGDGLPYLADTASGNLRVSSFWRDQVERKDKCFHSTSVQFSRSVVFDSFRPHKLQHTRPPCQSPTPGVHSTSCPLSWWCHPTISLL